MNNSQKKILIYTVISNNHDFLPIGFYPVSIKNLLVDYLIISDTFHFNFLSNWKHIVIENIFYDERIYNRSLKFNLAKYFDIKDYDYILYMDASLSLRYSIYELIKTFIMSNKDILLLRHDERNSILDEIEHCYKIGKISANERNISLNYLNDHINKGYNDIHLFSCGLFIYKNNLKTLSSLEKVFHNYSHLKVKRDQFLVPLFIVNSKLNLMIFEIQIKKNNYFHFVGHKKCTLNYYLVLIKTIFFKIYFIRLLF